MECNMKAKSAMLMASLAMLLLSQPAFGASAFTVTLSNGNVIEANSYTIRDGRVYLKYPTGEASFPARQVTSIKSADGGVELLQSEGAFVPRKEPERATNASAPDKPVIVHGKGDLNPRKPAARQRPARRNRDEGQPAEASSTPTAPRQSDPRVEELSRMLDSADPYDEKQQQEIDKKMDAIFDEPSGKTVDFSQIKGKKKSGASE